MLLTTTGSNLEKCEQWVCTLEHLMDNLRTVLTDSANKALDLLEDLEYFYRVGVKSLIQHLTGIVHMASSLEAHTAMK